MELNPPIGVCRDIGPIWIKLRVVRLWLWKLDYGQGKSIAVRVARKIIVMIGGIKKKASGWPIRGPHMKEGEEDRKMRQVEDASGVKTGRWVSSRGRKVARELGECMRGYKNKES